jgi:hypothetical protein
VKWPRLIMSSRMLSRKKIFRLSAGLVLALLCLELFSRVGLSLPILNSSLRRNCDYSFRQFWLRGHSGREKMQHVQDTYHSRLGWFSIPGLSDIPVYEDKFLNTNSLGLRGTYEPKVEKPQGKTRILFFGDSFTFGDEVSDDETYCHYLQQAIPQAEVINMGVHGYGHDQMLILLKDVGLNLAPDLVVLGFVDADTYRNTLSFRDFAKPRFELSNGQLILTNVPVPTPEQVLANESFRSAAWDLYGLLQLSASQQTGEYEKQTRRLTRAIIREFVHYVRESGAEPIIFFLPTPSEVQRIGKNQPVVEDFVEKIGKKMEPPLMTFSTLPGFEHALEAGVELKRHGHWDPRGNRIIADQIADFLVEHKLISDEK